MGDPQRKAAHTTGIPVGCAPPAIVHQASQRRKTGALASSLTRTYNPSQHCFCRKWACSENGYTQLQTYAPTVQAGTQRAPIARFRRCSPQRFELCAGHFRFLDLNRPIRVNPSGQDWPHSSLTGNVAVKREPNCPKRCGLACVVDIGARHQAEPQID